MVVSDEQIFRGPAAGSRAIPFNRPHLTGRELEYIRDVLEDRHLAGDGTFTRRCHALLKERTGAAQALLTHSCTAALEMAALLADLQPGDEVIMPSFTFVSTANAFVLRGAVPVFVDIREDTLNIDENLIEPAITDRTKAIAVVHYAGVACAMDEIMAIAAKHNLLVIEDAAQGVGATYKARALGTIGALGTFSFHETKNVVSGEGGALLVNDPALVARAEIIREKGTDRSRFLRGEVDKYTWQDIGSSYLPSELTAAFLFGQLESADEINAGRLAVWNRYHAMFLEAEKIGNLRRPRIPPECTHNAHMYYVLLPDPDSRTVALERSQKAGIGNVFHYVPLHSAPAGRRYCRVHGELPLTEQLSSRLVRLPMWYGLTEGDQVRVRDVIAP